MPSFLVQIATLRHKCAQVGKSQGSQPKYTPSVVACAQGRHSPHVHIHISHEISLVSGKRHATANGHHAAPPTADSSLHFAGRLSLGLGLWTLGYLGARVVDGEGIGGTSHGGDGARCWVYLNGGRDEGECNCLFLLGEYSDVVSYFVPPDIKFRPKCLF